MKEQQEHIEYVYENPGHTGTGAVLIVVYFLILAIMMVPASHFHLGMQGVFFAMAGAGAALGLGYLAFKFVRSRMEAIKLSRRGFAQMMVGYAPEKVIESTEEQSTERGLVVIEEDKGNNDELPELIIEDNPLRLATTFQPNINSILGAMLLLCGIRRSGKSNLLAVLAEELGRYAVPVVIFDTEDEYSGLVDPQYLPRGVHAGSADLQGESQVRYAVVNVDGAYGFGKAILDGHLQAVVNLKSWDDEDAALIMAEIIDGLNDWEQERANKDRIPVIVMLDEAAKWLPQNTGDSYVSKETQTLLHHAFFDIVVARGGKRGFGFVAACQRYSQINKNVLQSLWKFLFLQTEDTDLTRYERLGLDREDVAALRQGECFIFSPQVIGFKAMIRERHSPHMGHTPGLDDLMTHSRQLAPMQTVLSQGFTGGMVQKEASRPAPRHKDAELLQRGVNAYQEGATSIDKLAAALEITPHAARQLKPRVEAELQRTRGNEE